MKTEMQALTLFNERVGRLTRSSLAKRMANPRYTLDYERMMRGEWLSVDGVTEEAVDAFVLNARLLTQDQDGFSIRCLAKDVYAQGAVPADLQSQFDGQRQRWREHMDRPSVFEHFRENRNFTNGELFDVLMYGGLAHANRDKVAHFRGLTKQGASSSIVCVSFLESLRLLLDVVQAIRDINEELLRHWERSQCHAHGREFRCAPFPPVMTTLGVAVLIYHKEEK
jgi:hypothetical protein